MGQKRVVSKSNTLEQTESGKKAAISKFVKKRKGKQLIKGIKIGRASCRERV